jgi:hypothetical protein
MRAALLAFFALLALADEGSTTSDDGYGRG